MQGEERVDVGGEPGAHRGHADAQIAGTLKLAAHAAELAGDGRAETYPQGVAIRDRGEVQHRIAGVCDRSRGEQAVPMPRARERLGQQDVGAQRPKGVPQRGRGQGSRGRGAHGPELVARSVAHEAHDARPA